MPSNAVFTVPQPCPQAPGQLIVRSCASALEKHSAKKPPLPEKHPTNRPHRFPLLCSLLTAKRLRLRYGGDKQPRPRFVFRNVASRALKWRQSRPYFVY